MESIRKNLIRSFGLSEHEVEVFLSAFAKVELLKGERFIQEGKTCHKIGLIEKGLMKCAYHKDGIEVIDEFAFDKSFVTNYYSFLTKEPSGKEITCIEDCIVHVIYRDRLEELAETYSFIRDMARMISEQLFLSLHNRLKSIRMDSAETRYLNLVSHRPDLMERIPQYLIASYLNVQPETISRIRKKLSMQALS